MKKHVLLFLFILALSFNTFAMCGAPSEVSGQVIAANENSTSAVRNVTIDVTVMGEIPYFLTTKRVNYFGFYNLGLLTPCTTYRIQPRMVKGYATFYPTHVDIYVYDGEPIILNFATSVNYN